MSFVLNKPKTAICPRSRHCYPQSCHVVAVLDQELFDFFVNDHQYEIEICLLTLIWLILNHSHPKF